MQSARSLVLGLIALVIAGAILAMHGLATSAAPHDLASHPAAEATPGHSSVMHRSVSEPDHCDGCGHSPLRHLGSACTMALLAVGAGALAVATARNRSWLGVPRRVAPFFAMGSVAQLRPLPPPDRFSLSVMRC